MISLINIIGEMVGHARGILASLSKVEYARLSGIELLANPIARTNYPVSELLSGRDYRRFVEELSHRAGFV